MHESEQRRRTLLLGNEFEVGIGVADDFGIRRTHINVCCWNYIEGILFTHLHRVILPH